MAWVGVGLSVVWMGVGFRHVMGGSVYVWVWHGWVSVGGWLRVWVGGRGRGMIGWVWSGAWRGGQAGTSILIPRD